MTLITLALALYYICTWLGSYLDSLPKWTSFFAVPIFGYGLTLLPSIILTALAISGIVHLVISTTQRTQTPKVPKRTRNVPPLP